MDLALLFGCLGVYAAFVLLALTPIEPFKEDDL
jgi:hypothetical protein